MSYFIPSTPKSPVVTPSSGQGGLELLGGGIAVAGLAYATMAALGLYLAYRFLRSDEGKALTRAVILKKI